MTKNYVHNLETGKIELHFEKSDYLALTAEQKKELKRFYLWSNYRKAWVSRSKKDHYWSKKTAEKLGFTECEKVGQRLSYEEELQVKAEKAERRAERFEQYAENAQRKGKEMQAELNSFRGDVAFFTQPIISGHSGSQAFGKRRQKIFDRYFKGFEEYRKSEYFKERAITAQQTAEQGQLKSKVYLNNRIKECNSTIKKLEGNIVYYEQILYNKENNLPVSSFYEEKTPEQIQNWLDETLDKMEWQLDKLAFLENCLDDLGGVQYNKSNIKPGYLIKVRGRWAKVEKANPKTVQGDYLEAHLKGCYCQYPYAEIQEMKIPEGWTEQKEITENPFKVGDIVTRCNIGGNRIIAAFQVVKTTDKTITIRKIEVENNKPVPDMFISDKTERKTVKKDRYGNWVVNDGSWYMYKYAEAEQTA